MTKQTEYANSLVGSPAGFSISRLCTLTLTAILIAGGANAAFGQDQQPAAAPPPAAPAPAAPAPAKPVPPVPATEAAGKKFGNYQAHSVVELGGNIVSKDGSSAMWATMVNESTGMRLVGQSLDMHSTNPSKTPFFDSLSTSSYGYGGEPVNFTYLKLSKGKWYDFDSSFRRSRSYFDYNLFVNSFLTNATSAAPVLVPEPSTLHLYNTVRRDTNILITFLPVSRISFRAGYNHGTTEGPSYSSAHVGGDVSLYQWFRNGLDTYVGGVDAKLAKRTMLSYDQFYGLYRGDTSYILAPTPFTLLNGTPTSLGVNVLTGPTQTCGSGATKTQNVINGIANPYCNQTLVASMGAPTRTSFPTEQVRFSSHYWDKVAMNGRFTYSGGVSNVNGFNQTFNGLLSRTTLRQRIDTGALNDRGRLAHNKRINVNADYGIEAELNKYISISDAFRYWDVRVPGHSILATQLWDNTPFVTGGPTPVPSASLNVNTPLNQLHNYSTTTETYGELAHKNTGNTIVGTFNAAPGVKISGGWRFNNRDIKFEEDPTMSWHQNGALAGLVVQPNRVFRFNLDYDSMNSHSANSETPSDTYTRLAPNSFHHVRARAMVNPKSWVNFGVTINSYRAKNDDPLVNHTERTNDFSFAVQFIPMENLTLDFNYAHDSVFSQMDMCYIFTATANATVPGGATNSGTCVPSASNPTATSNLYLGYGYYNAPSDFFIGALNYNQKRFKLNGGARFNNLNGSAELLNPYNPPGALLSKTVSPFANLQVFIAPQWSWNGYWVHHGYAEGGPPGGSAVAPGSLLPGRDYHGDVYTLSVKYAF